MFVVLILTGLGVAQGATPEQVDAAIKKGVAWIYSQQNERGNWETAEAPSKDARKEHAKTDGAQWGGLTAISTYALLDAGESWKDPRVKNAVEWLYRAPLIGTYATALRAQVWQYLPQNPMVKSAAQRDANMLLAGVKSREESKGFWSYVLSDHATARYDHSCSQIALLGMWACQQAGRDVPLAFWQAAERAWRNHQLEDGSWSYVYKAQNEHGQPKMSMTLAGVATLFITQDYVHAQDGLACKGNLFDDKLAKGTKWIHDHMGEGIGGGGYNLYCFERVAMASGYKYFGTHDWYKEGAESVVKRQQADGSWGSIPESAFCLIFLSRGRQPVVVNKFEYELEGTPPKNIKPIMRVGPELLPEANQPDQPQPNPDQPKPADAPKTFIANWCQRPRDIAAFTRWMSSSLERRLNWQIISDTVSVDDFQDAPVLYMSGNQKLTLPKATVNKLRQYIEEGGLLFGHPDCSSKEFTESFIELGKLLFPTYEFRELPESHPIFTLQQYQRRNWKSPPRVLAMSNGARELMIISPENDTARYWQQMQYKGHEEAFELLNSIILYASDRRNLKYRGSTHIVRPDPQITDELRKIRVARLAWQGNWNPEPAGWRRLSAILQNQKLAKFTAEPFKLGETKLNMETHPIAHITGTGGYTLTKEQLTELKKYVAKGGILICDATGGNAEFAEAMQTQLAGLITGSAFQPIAPDDPIFKEIKEGSGVKIGDPMLANINIPVPIFAPATMPTTGPATLPAGTQPATSRPVGMPVAGNRTVGLLPTAGPATAPTTQPGDEPTTQPAAGGRAMLPGNVPVEYRKFARTRVGDLNTLRLKGIKFRNKWAVIFSAEDLSTGLVGQQVDGIHGYSPSCATEIMRRMVINLVPPPPPPPNP